MTSITVKIQCNTSEITKLRVKLFSWKPVGHYWEWIISRIKQILKSPFTSLAEIKRQTAVIFRLIFHTATSHHSDVQSNEVNPFLLKSGQTWGSLCRRFYDQHEPMEASISFITDTLIKHKLKWRTSTSHHHLCTSTSSTLCLSLMLDHHIIVRKAAFPLILKKKNPHLHKRPLIISL